MQEIKQSQGASGKCKCLAAATVFQSTKKNLNEAIGQQWEVLEEVQARENSRIFLRKSVSD